MRIPARWERTTPARWFSLVLGGLVAGALAVRGEAAPAPQQLLGEGIRAAREQRWAAAAQNLEAARARLPELVDYAAYWLAWVEFQRGNYASAVAAVEPVWKTKILSPLRGKAALLAAQAHLEMQNARAARQLLRERWAELPQPEGEAMLAAALEAAGEPAAAAAAWQRVYFGYPASVEAAAARQALERLRQALGERYPPPMAEQLIERAEYWMRVRQYRRARAEYEELTRALGGSARELARVRVGAALYRDYETAAAWDYLRSFEAADPEADAERLYYLVECARRLKRDADMHALLDRLARLYPRSSWRLRALISAGNRYLLENQTEQYTPLFRACAEDFSQDPESRYCHWKVTWLLYQTRQAGAAEALREHLERYPFSEQAAAALYFLGRLAEAGGRSAQARAWYEAITDRFPGYYHATLAVRRLQVPELARAAPAPEVRQFLAALPWPARLDADGFEPSEAMRLRLRRARLLRSAGLPEAVDEELKFSARVDGRPYLAALEWGEQMHGAEPVHRVVRTMKELARGYLNLRQEAAPKRFWEIMFPLPHRHLIETYSGRYKLDPFLVAGLIRQESEFNAGAVSPARAYGLMQILPSQGRILARQLRLPGYRTARLFQPAVNIRLGTYFLRSLLDKYDGRLEPALAAYNAGPRRVDNWLTWADFREPAEFIESIPFTETRGYVQAVLRNAEFYRQIYATAPAAGRAPAPQATAPRPKAAARSGAAPKAPARKPR